MPYLRMLPDGADDRPIGGGLAHVDCNYPANVDTDYASYAEKFWRVNSLALGGTATVVPVKSILAVVDAYEKEHPKQS